MCKRGISAEVVPPASQRLRAKKWLGNRLSFPADPDAFPLREELCATARRKRAKECARRYAIAAGRLIDEQLLVTTFKARLSVRRDLTDQCICITIMQLHYQEEVMPPMLTSKVTARAQTTLPPGVRKVLSLGPGERVGYVIEGNDVRLVNASALDNRDPVLTSFLELLVQDLEQHPERVAAFPRSLLERARAAVAGVEIDHDAEIEDAITI